MPFIHQWNATQPQGTIAGSQIDDEIRLLRVSIAERMDQIANWSSNHIGGRLLMHAGTARNDASTAALRPGPEGEQGQLYQARDTGETSITYLVGTTPTWDTIRLAQNVNYNENGVVGSKVTFQEAQTRSLCLNVTGSGPEVDVDFSEPQLAAFNIGNLQWWSAFPVSPFAYIPIIVFPGGNRLQVKLWDPDAAAFSTGTIQTMVLLTFRR